MSLGCGRWSTILDGKSAVRDEGRRLLVTKVREGKPDHRISTSGSATAADGGQPHDTTRAMGLLWA